MTNYSKVIGRGDINNSKLWLYAIARRALGIQQEAGMNVEDEDSKGLSPARLLNRLHSVGIDCNQADLDAALDMKEPNSKEAGLTLAEVAALAGVETAVLQGWLDNPEQQEDMPTLGEVYRSAAGKSVTYDYFDALMVKRWKIARETAPQ